MEEVWPNSDATRAHVLPPDAAVDAALAKAGKLDELETYYGMTADQLRVRVRGELAERALADRALRRTHSAAAYGRYFVLRAKRHRAQTRCHAPYDPEDRCRGGGHDAGDGPSIPLGVGALARYDLELDLAPLLQTGSFDPRGTSYRKARDRLRRALPKALAKRVKLSFDAYEVYVRGSTPDEIAVARIAHRLALGHRTPVLK
jgi:hypothetical protein